MACLEEVRAAFGLVTVAAVGAKFTLWVVVKSIGVVVVVEWGSAWRWRPGVAVGRGVSLKLNYITWSCSRIFFSENVN